MSVPAKAQERIKAALKRYQPIIEAARARDGNESDTVIVITDILEAMFGYDKYTEITSEHSIRSTFCDLAIKIDNELAFLLEAKAIGIELKDQHIKQAIDYAANQGIDWVVLSNAVEWRVYKVTFTKPINFETVLQFNILELSHKNSDDIAMLGVLAKEGWKKAKIEEHYSLQQYLNKFTLGALLLSDSVINVVRRELRRVSTDIKISEDELRALIESEVIKREILEGEKAEQAAKLVGRAAKKYIRKPKNSDDESNVLKLEKAKQKQGASEKEATKAS